MQTIAATKLTATAFLLLVTVPLCADADERAEIDAIVKPFLKDKPYLGIVVGITRNGERQVFGYGKVTLNGKEQTPAGDTHFEIGSMTKMFAGTLLADQVLEGNVLLDDPAQRHLPDALVLPRRDDRDITLLHLATHTSGLPVQPPAIGLFALTTKDPANPYAEFDEKKLAQTLSSLKLSGPIGSKHDYSNLGVGLLGHALAHAGKTGSFEELLLKRILNPLKLADTRFNLSAEQQKRLAPGHDASGKPTSPWTFATLEACGGLRSTIDDMLIFADAALGREKTLNKAFRMAQDRWRELPQPSQSIGLCWFRQQVSAGKMMLWHNGGTGGYRSFFAILPEDDCGVVVLSNSPHFVDALGIRILSSLSKSD